MKLEDCQQDVKDLVLLIKNIVHKQKTSYPLFIYQPRGQGLGKDTLGTRAVR